MLPLIPALLILLAYTPTLWWLLRCEATTTMPAPVALRGLSFALQLGYPTEFPPGFNQDQPRILNYVVELPNALFQTQLLPLLGP